MDLVKLMILFHNRPTLLILVETLPLRISLALLSPDCKIESLFFDERNQTHKKSPLFKLLN
jgi:hypothetical protein